MCVCWEHIQSSDLKFKLGLSKGMSRQLEISIVSPECVYSFPDSQEYVGAYQGLLWLSHSSGHPVKFLADFMIAPTNIAASASGSSDVGLPQLFSIEMAVVLCIHFQVRPAPSAMGAAIFHCFLRLPW